MSKPTLVTLPFLLLLLDWWPLDRVPRAGGARAWGKLIVEKIPFFALSAVASLVTLTTQRWAGALSPTGLLEPMERIWKPAAAYLLYVFHTLWPEPLAVFYPIRAPHRSAVVGMVAIVILGLLTGWAWSQRRRRPYLLFGWLWFIVTLVPVVGFIQSGQQVIADRFTYVPCVGFFLAAALAADEWAATRWRRVLAVAFLAIVLITLGSLSVRYVQQWKDTETLFRHSLASVGDSALLKRWLGQELERQGRYSEALIELEQSIAMAPTTPTLIRRARLLDRLGRSQASIEAYAQALGVAGQWRPHEVAPILSALGDLHLREGRAALAAEHYERALSLRPELPGALRGRAELLAREGRALESVALLEAGLEQHPDSPELNLALAWLRATHPDPLVRRPEEVPRLVLRVRRETRALRVRLRDALAASEAARGRFWRALAALREAQAILDRGSREDRELADLSTELDARRALYATRQVYLADYPLVHEPKQSGEQGP
jgi:tetratricopeptide (TPR) repeat protein